MILKYLYIQIKRIMKKINSEKDKRIRISISMNPELHDMIVDNTTNKSKYIERAILEYFSKNDIDTSKIKL